MEMSGSTAYVYEDVRGKQCILGDPFENGADNYDGVYEEQNSKHISWMEKETEDAVTPGSTVQPEHSDNVHTHTYYTHK